MLSLLENNYGINHVELCRDDGLTISKTKGRENKRTLPEQVQK